MTPNPDLFIAAPKTALSGLVTSMEAALSVGDPCMFTDNVNHLLRELSALQGEVGRLTRDQAGQPAVVQERVENVVNVVALEPSRLYEAVSAVLADVAQLGDLDPRPFLDLVREVTDKTMVSLAD